MSASLHERARRVRARAAVRAWEYRQREHARGVWYRLRRTLAGARAAYAIDEADAAALLAEGARPLAVGAELAPEKIILLVGEEQVARLPSARPIPLALGVDLLTARRLALVPFES